jgi:hypothetical protein
VQLLSANKVLSAAILDEEGEYLGAVSVPDVLRGLIRNLEVSQVTRPWTAAFDCCSWAHLDTSCARKISFAPWDLCSSVS